MIRSLPFLLLAPLLAAAPVTDSLLKSRPEADEIQWKDPARGVLAVRIVQATSTALTVDKTLPSGPTTREVPLAELSRISYRFAPREEELHRQPSAGGVAALRVLWDARRATIGFAGSNAGETGVALAKSLRLAGSDLDAAAPVLDQVIAAEKDTRIRSLALAEQTTLQFARSLKSAKPADLDHAAWKITEESPDNPEAMLLATRFLAERHFAELKELEKANPRWMDDDEVKPVRERLHNLALDFSLYPVLFQSARDDEASAGLRRAAEVHEFAGDPVLAKQTLEDLAALYPESAPAKETAAWLGRLHQPEATEKAATPDAATDKPADSTPVAAPPPAPRKYNIFGD